MGKGYCGKNNSLTNSHFDEELTQMERPYLLTYRMEREGNSQYSWFYTEKELRDFIKNENPWWVFDAIKINNTERLDLESE